MFLKKIINNLRIDVYIIIKKKEAKINFITNLWATTKIWYMLHLLIKLQAAANHVYNFRNRFEVLASSLHSTNAYKWYHVKYLTSQTILKRNMKFRTVT